MGKWFARVRGRRTQGGSPIGRNGTSERTPELEHQHFRDAADALLGLGQKLSYLVASSGGIPSTTCGSPPGPDCCRLKPAPRSEKADIGSTENSTDIRRIKTSWLRPRAHAPSTCAISAEKSAPLAQSPMYFFYRNYWFQTKNALSDFLGAQGFRTALPGHKSIGAVGGRYLVVHFSAIPPSERPGIATCLAI